ncbi:site-specific integrase [Plectonema radiosum NIES-515]|uniref:Site-specific integrase n=1 Tax=Plectonema radiosum NIES-515 TaxID=2986073 RepID=A0ABT3B3S2_9CYAN|nr:site-specific integrase [Plectonema radiosum]MCV3216012.1 site-specific integrase [Plectonema radiosum NIES-515]
MEFSDQLSTINIRLKTARIGVAVCQVKNRLYLRATLPPKPNSTKTNSHQQWLSLGIYANKDGLKRAEAEAHKLGGLLACKDFKWELYLKNPGESPGNSIKDWIRKFEKFYFETRQRNHQTETTWKIDYLAVFNKLPGESLSSAVILKAVTNTRPDTKTRKRTCMALSALAKFAEIDINLKSYAGRYSPRKVTPRDLPHDTAIAQHFYQIEDEAWRWVYGMLATYGLRNHEVFRLDFAAIARGDYIVNVGENSKTGARRVWPCFPEWFDQFNLQEVKLPKVNLDRPNAEVGHAATTWFHRHIPFQAYDLRHCWAVRTLEFGLDVSLAAQQMGHSAQTHTELYHHWINERHHQRAFELMMHRTERPTAPVVLGYSKDVKFR